MYFTPDVWGENGDTVQEWTGITASTPDSQPVVGEAPGRKGLWLCVGFNGHGMAMAWQAGLALLEMIADDEDIGSQIRKKGGVDDWFPQSWRLERIFKEKWVEEDILEGMKANAWFGDQIPAQVGGVHDI